MLCAALDRVRRRRDGHTWLFLVNDTPEAQAVHAVGHDLVADARVDGSLVLPAGGVAVVRES